MSHSPTVSLIPPNSIPSPCMHAALNSLWMEHIVSWQQHQKNHLTQTGVYLTNCSWRVTLSLQRGNKGKLYSQGEWGTIRSKKQRGMNAGSHGQCLVNLSQSMRRHVGVNHNHYVNVERKM